jgi:two-component system sensor kinase FixL
MALDRAYGCGPKRGLFGLVNRPADASRHPDLESLEMIRFWAPAQAGAACLQRTVPISPMIGARSAQRRIIRQNKTMDDRGHFNPHEEASRILAAIVESSDDAIIGKDLDGRILTWNRGAEGLYGYTADEVTGRSIELLFPEDRLDELDEILARSRSGQRVQHHETVRRRKDGQLVDISLTVSPISDATGRIVGASTIARDITARKRAELALRASEQRWRSVVESAVDGIVVIDARGRIEAFNPAVERLFGYTEAELLGRNVSVLMPPPYRDEHDSYLGRYLATGAAKIIGKGREVSGRRRDGRVFPLHLSVGEMSLGGERKFTGMLHDLSSRVDLEDRLRASEARWRSVIDSAVDGIIVIAANGHIEAFNPAAERLFGYREQEVVGQNVNVLMPAPYHEEHDAYLARYLATGVQRIIGIGREITGRRRDGSTFPLHLSVGEMVTSGERRFTGILHDLTARVRMEEQLREQAALASLGEMAALIAHEVKNPLAGIRGAVQVIGGRLPAESREAAIAKEIVARIDGLNGLVKDLLLYARPPRPRPQLVDLRSLLNSTASLLAGDPAVAGVRVDVHGTARPVMADPELLKIVFVNVLVNGAQAMQGKGVLRVSVASVDSHCRLSFHDSGPGIPADIREKIFTPFFTTKSAGSGLGLPTAKRLIEAHAGTIRIECPPDGGTMVTVHLPAIAP